MPCWEKKNGYWTTERYWGLEPRFEETIEREVREWAVQKEREALEESRRRRMAQTKRDQEKVERERAKMREKMREAEALREEAREKTRNAEDLLAKAEQKQREDQRDLAKQSEQVRQSESQARELQRQANELLAEAALTKAAAEALQATVRKKEKELKSSECELEQKQKEVDEILQREEQRTNDATTLFATLEDKFATGNNDLNQKWEAESLNEVCRMIEDAQQKLDDLNLPKAHAIIDQALERLRQINDDAIQAQVSEDMRKKYCEILARKLKKLGYKFKRAGITDKTDPRSDVIIDARLPNNQQVFWTLRHDGKATIQQAGVDSHEECHTVEDAIVAAIEMAGLKLWGGKKKAGSQRNKRITVRSNKQRNQRRRQ